jgi:hypothetical protein
MKFLYEGRIEEFDFSVTKAFAEYAGVPEEIAQKTLQRMTLSDYAAFVSALDSEDENTINKMVDKYIENEEEVVLGENIEFYNTKPIISRFSVMEERSRALGLPFMYANAFKSVITLSESELNDYLGVWLVNEDTDFRMKRDIAVHKYIYENTVNPQLKQNVARLANKSASQVTSPTYTDDKDSTKKDIVSADPQKNIIATQDEKGNVEVVQLDQQKKKQIALESLKRLAGIK